MLKRIVVPGIVTGLAMLLAGMALSRGFMAMIPELQTEYENTSLFRSSSDPMMMIYFVQPFITGLILAWIWDRTKTLFSSGTAAGKGARFGAVYWIFSLGGMVISYSSFPISLSMIATWYLSILFQGLLAGILLAKLNSPEKT